MITADLRSGTYERIVVFHQPKELQELLTYLRCRSIGSNDIDLILSGMFENLVCQSFDQYLTHCKLLFALSGGIYVTPDKRQVFESERFLGLLTNLAMVLYAYGQSVGFGYTGQPRERAPFFVYKGLRGPYLILAQFPT